MNEVDGNRKYNNFFVNVNQWVRKMGVEKGDLAKHTRWLPMPYWVMPELKIEFAFLQEKDKMELIPKIVKYLDSINPISIIIFTDGSSDPVNGRSGFGVYVEKLGMKIGRRISNGSSVLAAELMAILWALWWIEEASPREALICSDSAAALETLRAGKSEARPDIVNDILSVFFRVGFACNITFCWVPGHAGVLGNEQADYIAKESLGREIP